MPLKLKDVSHPSSTATLNNWADQREQEISSHTTQIRTLTSVIQSLLKKNPDLKVPNGIKG
jgi:hypothetical protein